MTLEGTLVVGDWIHQAGKLGTICKRKFSSGYNSACETSLPIYLLLYHCARHIHLPSHSYEEEAGEGVPQPSVTQAAAADGSNSAAVVGACNLAPAFVADQNSLKNRKITKI